MKDYKIVKYGDYYEVKYGSDGYVSGRYKTYEDSVNEIYKYYQNIKTVEESEIERSSRLQREKSINRNNKIDQILG
jgi:hypothetical protein